MSSIQVLKPKFHIDECLEQVRECLEKGWTGSGFKTAELETKWKEYTGHANACFLNSNTSGLHLAFNILKRHGGWQDGDEVISTPITFVATNHAILYEGLKPVFADVGEYLCMDPGYSPENRKKIREAMEYCTEAGIADLRELTGGNSDHIPKDGNDIREAVRSFFKNKSDKRTDNGGSAHTEGG